MPKECAKVSPQYSVFISFSFDQAIFGIGVNLDKKTSVSVSQRKLVEPSAHPKTGQMSLRTSQGWQW